MLGGLHRKGTTLVSNISSVQGIIRWDNVSLVLMSSATFSYTGRRISRHHHTVSERHDSRQHNTVSERYGQKGQCVSCSCHLRPSHIVKGAILVSTTQSVKDTTVVNIIASVKAIVRRENVYLAQVVWQPSHTIPSVKGIVRRENVPLAHVLCDLLVF